MALIRSIKGTEFIIDDEDLEMVSLYLWNIRQANYVQSTHFGKTVFLHRLLMGLTDFKDKRVVDHINGNSLDNRKSNLRVCTIKENVRNRGPSTLNTTGYKGVFKTRCGFVAKITVDRKTLHLGNYILKEDAAMAYDIAAIRHFKEFAWLNFKMETYTQNDFIPPKSVHPKEKYLNRKGDRVSSTGLKGVIFMNKKKHYRVSKMIEGKNYYLGSFKELELARLAYENFINDLNGPYQTYLKTIREAS